MPMIRAERARQFMPFDALTGFKDALKEKEQVHIRRKELSDEANEELSMKLNAIDTNKIVQITYYDGNKYTKIKGKVNKIDKINRTIIVTTSAINFFDIIAIEIM